MLKTLRWVGVLVVVACTSCRVLAADDVQFNRDIRPILSANCFACHGPDGGHRKKNLRFDDRAVATAALEDGKTAIVPGDPAASEMVKRISSDDPKYRMPPAESHKPPLSAQQIDTIRKWIASGAEYQQHWSLITPTRPEPPAVDDSKWPRNEIDRFTLAKMRSKGLEPQAEADRATLLRRVSFDLTGLPPTPDQVAAFVNDADPGAYEKAVDRLLASEHYGEHMARYWLDVVRYGDTHGLHLDNYREIWPYRDWVIRAFNANMPFDQFTIRQIAGDLIDKPTTDDLIASGYCRMNVTTNEGGSIKEEVYVRNVVDRTETTGSAFMGLTVGCAVCHDHKFDPISQKEFYQLFAFFNNVDGDPMDGNVKDHAPIIRVPTDEQTRQLAELREQVKTLDEQADAAAMKIAYDDPFAAGIPGVPGDLKRRTIVWIDDEAPKNAEFGGEAFDWITADQGPVHSGKRSMKRDSNGNEQHYFAKCDQPLRVGPGDKLFAWVYLDPEHMPKEIMLQYHSSNWLHRAYWGENLIPYGKDNSTERKRLGNLPEAGKWVKLEVDAGTIGIQPGTVITGMAFTQYDGVSYWDQVGVDTLTAQEPVDFVWIDDDLPAGAEPGGDGKAWQWVGDKEHVHSGLRALRRSGGDGLNQDYFLKAKSLQLHADDQLFAYVYLDPASPPKSIQLQFNNGEWGHRVRWGAPAHGAGAKNGADYVASQTIPETGRWVRLQVDLNKVGLKPGDKLVGWAFTQVGGTAYWDTAGVNTFNVPDDRHLKSLLVWETRYGDDKDTPADLRTIIDIPAEKRTEAQRDELKAHYVRFVYDGSRESFDAINEKIEQARKQIGKVEGEVPTTLVMKERPEPRQAWVLKRGAYDQHGEEVKRITPAALPPMADDLPRDRMGFAKWLVDPKHPLTSRVAVNRMWQQCFGTGLVETSEDFGSQGSGPSHPQLIDWLAVQFVADGWDMKKFIKRIVTSATYRQSSVIAPRKLEVDPGNRLLARGPRFRLDAEVLRDQALAVSGLLVDKLHGPPVRPPQPEGLWEAVGYTRSNTAKFKADSGPDIFRRSVYSFWKRTSPPPPMTTFDAPSRESCTMRRERTNTPLQALLLMNEIEYVEAARNLAQRAMLEAGAAPEQRLAFTFMLATAHTPSAEQAAIALDAYRDHLKEFQRDASAAKQLVEYGQSKPDAKLDAAELAAWTMVANLVLNCDQALNKN